MIEAKQGRITAIIIAAFILLAALIIVLDRIQIHQITGKAQWLLAFMALFFIISSNLCLSFGYVLVNQVFGIRVGWWKLFEIPVLCRHIINGYRQPAGW